MVREIDTPHSRVVWTPKEGARQIHTHRGVVLALGPPSLLDFMVDGRVVTHPVPWDFAVGDVVQYHWEHNEEAFTKPWPDDGKPASWVPQRCVDGVIE